MTQKLRPFQKQALESLKKKPKLNLVVLAATGTGKSKIYEEACLKLHRKSLLLTPLKALGHQQIQKLESLGLSIISHWRGSIARQMEDAEKKKTHSVWITSPESLFQGQNLRTYLGAYHPSLLILDECHCLWEWGQSFRPAFQNIPELLNFPSIQQSIWLTATLPGSRIQELHQILGPHSEIQGRFSLPENLSLSVNRVPWKERVFEFKKFLNAQGMQPGILFVFSRKSAEQLIQTLNEVPRSKIATYHAGLASEERLHLENQLKLQKISYVIATTAFGMGMDYPHLRWSLLWQAPPTLLTLAQCLGRVGRSNTEGQAKVFWDYSDFHKLQSLTQNQMNAQNQISEVQRFLGRCQMGEDPKEILLNLMNNLNNTSLEPDLESKGYHSVQKPPPKRWIFKKNSAWNLL